MQDIETLELRARLLSLPDDALWSEAEAAVVLDVNPKTLQKARYHGGGPSYIRLGARKVRYAKGAVLGWARSRTFANTTVEGVRARRKPAAEAQASV